MLVSISVPSCFLFSARITITWRTTATTTKNEKPKLTVARLLLRLRLFPLLLGHDLGEALDLDPLQTLILRLAPSLGGGDDPPHGRGRRLLALVRNGWIVHMRVCVCTRV